jgi:hypothetical protein
MIEPFQVKLIHTLLSVACVSDRSYRDNLSRRFNGATSCKQLTFDEAQELIDALEDFAVSLGFWTRSNNRNRYESLGNRPGMATPAQLRKIEGLWKVAMGMEDDLKAQRTLRVFIMNHFHVSDLRFLEQWKVSRVIRALEAIRDKHTVEKKAVDGI